MNSKTYKIIRITCFSIKARDTNKTHLNFKNIFVELYYEITVIADDRLSLESNNSISSENNEIIIGPKENNIAIIKNRPLQIKFYSLSKNT